LRQLLRRLSCVWCDGNLPSGITRRFRLLSLRTLSVPLIHGEFHTLAGGTLDVLLMKEEDYKGFAQNHSSEAAFSQPGSSGGTIDWAMPPTLLDPQKYYLVFSNILGDGPITVKADFSVDF